MSSYNFTRPGAFGETDTSKANYTPSPDNLRAQASIDQATTDASGHKYNSLKERLDNVDSVTSEKANQADLDTSNANINAIRTKSKFEKVSFPMSKAPNTLLFNATEKYYLEPIFYVPQTDNMQGIAFYDGYVYIGFDMGGGNGSIRKYDLGGVLVKDSGLLGLNHSADLAHRVANGHIYVANGEGANPTFVYEVDMTATTPSILNTLNFNSLGNSALLAINNDLDQLIIHTAASDTDNPTFSICRFDGTILSQFTIPNKGIPQGLDYYQGQLYFYTSNTVTVMDLTGNIINAISIPKSGESEGIAIAGDYTTPYMIVGYNSPNRIYALRSVDNQAQFHSYHPLTSVNRQDTPNIPLAPTILTMVINNNLGAGNWQAATWSNGFHWQNIIKTITCTTGSTGAITIKLNHPLKAVGYFATSDNFNLASQGYRSICDFTDPDTVTIQIYNATGTQIDPSTIPSLRTIRLMIVGAINLND